jgi:hypothetical protein
MKPVHRHPNRARRVPNPLMDDPLLKYRTAAWSPGGFPGAGLALFATYFILIADSSKVERVCREDEPQIIFVWKAQTVIGEVLCTGTTYVHRIGLNRFIESVLAAAIDALEQANVPAGSHVHILSNSPSFTKVLNERSADYQKKGRSRTKKPLRYPEQWDRLDAICKNSQLFVSASSWWSSESRWELNFLSKQALKLRRDLIGLQGAAVKPRPIR